MFFFVATCNKTYYLYVIDYKQTPKAMKKYNVSTTDGNMTIEAESKKDARVKAERIIRNDNRLSGAKEKIESITLVKE
jgi:hypothetical protein